jgi:glucose-1-phosphate thymidylyltransferase
MKKKGTKFRPGQVSEWLDCGNKNATVFTNRRILEYDKGKARLTGKNVRNQNSIVIGPCFIGDDVELTDSIIGPYTSIGKGTKIQGSIVRNSIVQSSARITNAIVENSMLGEGSETTGKPLDLSASDYTQVIA